MRCLIPCGGASSRMDYKQKVLIEIKGKPVLGYVIDFWRDLGITDFIFIIEKNSGRDIVNYVKTLNLKPSIFIDRKDEVNLARAICLAKPLIGSKFILALGDCLNIGRFLNTGINNIEFGIGVYKASSEELRKNYLVETKNNLVTRVVEKPEADVGLCGMGTFFFDRRIFNYIEALTLPKIKTSVDLTGAIQLAIDSGEKVFPVHFMGTYINITYPEDLKTAEGIL